MGIREEIRVDSGGTSSNNLDALLKLFRFQKKKDLRKYCKGLTVYSYDFVNFILACEQDILPFHHKIHHQDYIPSHLEPSDSDLRALAKNGVGRLNVDASRTVRKVFQLFTERRYLVGHIFYTSNLLDWHFFYFDQRDTELHNKQWVEGSHIHYINWLWPEHSAKSIWEKFTSGNVQMNGSLHLRWKDEIPLTKANVK